MKIGIDISQIVYQGTGVATYTTNLIKNLLEVDRANEFILFGSSLRRKDLLEKAFVGQGREFQRRFYPLPPLLLESLWNRWHKLPVETLIGSVDVFHTSDWLEPPSSCPKVTTIHDLAVYKYPETLPSKIVQNQKRKLEWVKKESKIIIAVSENTKEDIVDILKIPEDRVRVVYEAADNIYPSFAKATEGKQQKIEKIKQKYGISGQYILAVGTREPRKNLKRVLEAFNLRGKDFDDLNLIIVGKYGWGEDLEQLKTQNSKLKIVGYVPKEDLAALYSGAECFVDPSLYEGFGLPVLEAMASGCPVVTSKTSSLVEIGAGGAILVNPLDVEEIAEGVRKALADHDKFSKMGQERAKQFSWEKAARETLKVYEAVQG